MNILIALVAAAIAFALCVWLFSVLVSKAVSNYRDGAADFLPVIGGFATTIVTVLVFYLVASL